jgi:hypothetical protein
MQPASSRIPYPTLQRRQGSSVTSEPGPLSELDRSGFIDRLYAGQR